MDPIQNAKIAVELASALGVAAADVVVEDDDSTSVGVRVEVEGTQVTKVFRSALDKNLDDVITASLGNARTTRKKAE